MKAAIRLILCIGAVTACGNSSSEPASLDCTAAPGLEPANVPRLQTGQTTGLAVTTHCTTQPVMRWKSSDTLVARVSPVVGNSTTLLGRDAGVATVFVYAQDDAGYGTAVDVTVVSDTSVTPQRPVRAP